MKERLTYILIAILLAALIIYFKIFWYDNGMSQWVVYILPVPIVKIVVAAFDPKTLRNHKSIFYIAAGVILVILLNRSGSISLFLYKILAAMVGAAVMWLMSYLIRFRNNGT